MKNKKIVGFRVAGSTKSLLQKVAKARGEDISAFVRRAVYKELAQLGFIPKEQMKALGIRT